MNIYMNKYKHVSAKINIVPNIWLMMYIDNLIPIL